VSWAFEALAALKRIMLLEERITNLTTESKLLMDTCKDLDRRLIRLEAKFELIEHVSSATARNLPTSSGRLKRPRKKEQS
jgi:hypothetical protein